MLFRLHYFCLNSIRSCRNKFRNIARTGRLLVDSQWGIKSRYNGTDLVVGTVEQINGDPLDPTHCYKS